MLRINFWRSLENRLYFFLSKTTEEPIVLTGLVKTIGSSVVLDKRGSKKRLRLLLAFSLLERLKKLGVF